MFHRATDASKVALVELCARLVEAGGRLVDVQEETPHLTSLGQVLVRRAVDTLKEICTDERASQAAIRSSTGSSADVPAMIWAVSVLCTACRSSRSAALAIVCHRS